MTNSFDDLLNVSPDDIKSAGYSGNNDIYKPNTEKGKNGTYKAVIRFVPWHKDASKTLLKKWTAWLVNPADETGRSIDCPSSVGKKSPLYQVWKQYKDSSNPVEKAIAQRFSRKMKCFAPVQIIKDDNNPELVGKIMLFEFGKKVYDKIEEEMKSGSLDGDDGGITPWHLLQGRRFIVNVKKVGDWQNYDDCKFEGSSWPNIIVDGEVVNIAEADGETRKNVLKFLQEKTPDLEKYMFREWDEDTEEFVQTVIHNSINPTGTMVSGIKSSSIAKNKVKSADIDDVLADHDETISSRGNTSTSELDDIDSISDDDDAFADL